MSRARRAADLSRARAYARQWERDNAAKVAGYKATRAEQRKAYQKAYYAANRVDEVSG